MKKIYLLIITIVAFSSCSQNNTNPNNNNGPSNQCSILPNVFVDINYNGKNVHIEGSKVTSVNIVTNQTKIDSGGVTGSIYLNAGNNFDLIAIPMCTNNSQYGKQFFRISSESTSPIIDTGTYKGGSGALQDQFNTNLVLFDIPDSSLVIRITNLTTDYVTGNFTCHIVNSSQGVAYPANGSFHLLRKYQ